MIEPAFVLLLLGLAILWLLGRRGLLGSSAFAAAPPRMVELGLADLFIGVLLILLGGVAMGRVLAALNLPLGPPPESQPIDDWAEVQRGLLSQLMTLMPVAIFVLLRARPQPGGLREFGLISRRPGAEVAAAAVALLATVPLEMAVSSVTVLLSQRLGFQVPKLGHEMLRVLSESHSPAVISLLLLTAIVLAPLLEEIVFRGLVQTVLLNLLGRSHRWAVVLLAAGVFAFIHVGAASTEALPALFVLGIILGWLYERYGSLLPGILLHASFNALNAGWTMHLARSGGAAP